WISASNFGSEGRGFESLRDRFVWQCGYRQCSCKYGNFLFWNLQLPIALTLINNPRPCTVWLQAVLLQVWKFLFWNLQLPIALTLINNPRPCTGSRVVNQRSATIWD
ncbi:hypothetical protein MARPO_0144s0021, partial [Marchantia polymorpha]